jgi:hypothetical protein
MMQAAQSADEILKNPVPIAYRREHWDPVPGVVTAALLQVVNRTDNHAAGIFVREWMGSRL